MNARWLLAVLPLLAARSADASPSYAVQLDPTLREQAHKDLLDHARAAGVEDARAELLFKLGVVATSNDTGCPDVDVDVVNATDHTMWNVELEITQTLDKVDHTAKIHLPYLPTHTSAHARVPCIETYRSRYSPDGGIGLSYLAHATRDPAEALEPMQRELTDYLNLGGTLQPAAIPDKTWLVDALQLEDADVARELVLAIARSGLGLEELSAEIARVPGGAIAKEVGASLAKAPPSVQVGLARALLSSPEAASAIGQLSPLIDRLCRGKRVDAAKLWLAAQGGEHDIPVEALRARINTKCALTAADGGALAQAIDPSPDRAGAVLDAAPLSLFDAVVATWKARADKDDKARAAYARDTTDADRFDRVVATLPSAAMPWLFSELVKAKPAAATPHKAQWATAALARLDADAQIAVARYATAQMLEGRVAAPDMVAVVHAARDKAPDAAREVITAFATEERSPVFDVGKLPPALDAAEVIGLEQRALGQCTANNVQLATCLGAISAFPGLAKAAPAAMRPVFVQEIRSMVGKMESFDTLAEVGKELTAAGLTNHMAVDAACQLAERKAPREHWDDEAEDVARVDPTAACIETKLRATASQYRSRARWLWLFGLLGLIVPLPAGVFILRRRYRKLLAEMPKPEVEAAGQGHKLADRLGERGLGRGLRAAIAAAATDLASTPAGLALASIDDAVLRAIGDTVGRAVKSGDAATQLIRHTPDALYIVALPVRHARPQIAQRYLGAPWRDHVAAIQRAAQTSVVSLIVLCGPEAAEARLVVGFTPVDGDPRPAFEPESLLDARDARERGAQPFCHVMSLGEG